MAGEETTEEPDKETKMVESTTLSLTLTLKSLEESFVVVGEKVRHFVVVVVLLF